MGRREDLLARLQTKPRDFRWQEFTTLMKCLGYQRVGKQPGSARRFFRPATNSKILIHEPHPGNTLKAYQVQEVLNKLHEEGEI
jgi:hypothetical protein